MDDEGLRARVVEWLDTKPTLPKEEAALLRLAAERSDGWIEQLSGQAPKRSTRAKAAPDHKAMLERERERAKKAREETKRIRDDAQRSERDLRSEIARLKADLVAEKAKARALDKEVSAAISGGKQLRAQVERDRRKSRAEIAKIQQAGDGDKRELKVVKRELQQKERQLAKLEERIDQLTVAKKTSVRKQTPKGPRRRLPVPKGRLEDASETLEAWLRTAKVHLLIDGYNATMAEGGFGNLELADQRDRLIAEVGKLARKRGIEASIVFDGSDVVAGPRRGRKPVAVHYSSPDEIADDRLIALLEKMPKDPVVVVTSDRELQNRAKKLGATVATSRQFLSLLR
ncbi:MAG TPA: NYN domain-containing protein [Actinomycetota bacterium]|nr:NYN domain-containing protein [Actinomycetota bacterium]